MPQRLGEPHVPDSGDDSLIDERLADEARLVDSPNPADHRHGIRLGGEEVGTHRAHASGAELEQRPVPLRRLPLGTAKDEPRQPTPHAIGVESSNPPAPIHTEVAPDDDPAFEVQEHILPYGLYPVEHASIHHARDSGHTSARIGALGTQALRDEYPQTIRDAAE